MEVVLPSSHLNVPQPVRSTSVHRHRHRRSAAISGDFDAPASLWGANPVASSPSHTKSFSLAHGLSHSLGAAVDFQPELDRTFRFNNAEDFSVLPAQFAFPNTPAYDTFKTPPASPRAFNQTTWHGSPFAFGSPVSTMSPSHKRVAGGSRLDSPIRLGHSPSRSMPNARAFLTDELAYPRNVPEAIIDLDEALLPQRIGSPRTTLRRYSAETSDTHAPFRLATPPQPLLDAIFDTAAIKEEDDCEAPESDKVDQVLPAAAARTNFAPPPDVSLYCNSSAGSSLVSLGHSTAGGGSALAYPVLADSIGKDQDLDVPVMRSSLPRKQRLGAKASRYLSFYDQSSRVSNALKVLSLESINNFHILLSVKDCERRLGHLSSLPSLKQVAPRHTLISTRSMNLGRSEHRSVQPSSCLSQGYSASTKMSMRPMKPSNTLSSPSPKISSASPISIHLDGLSSTGTVELTDRLSITSHPEAHDRLHNHKKSTVAACPPTTIVTDCMTPPPKPQSQWTVDAHTPVTATTPDPPRELSASHRAALSSARIPSTHQEPQNPFARRTQRTSAEPSTHRRRHLLILLLKLDKHSGKRSDPAYETDNSDRALVVSKTPSEMSTSSKSSRTSRIRRFFKGGV